MLNPEITAVLNKQVELEAQSSHSYLAMAVWAETQGYDGTATFLYRHAEEERVHMLKLIQFINERGSKAIIPALSAPNHAFNGLKEAFESVLLHETRVTESINEVVDICLKVKDYPTYNFMQWYVAEQLEEEGLARRILDRLALAGDASGALYHFDRDISSMEGGVSEPTA
jgi:ferritin